MFSVYVCLLACISVFSAHGWQKRVLDPPKLGLWVTVNYHLSALN